MSARLYHSDVVLARFSVRLSFKSASGSHKRQAILKREQYEQIRSSHRDFLLQYVSDFISGLIFLMGNLSRLDFLRYLQTPRLKSTKCAPTLLPFKLFSRGLLGIEVDSKYHGSFTISVRIVIRIEASIEPRWQPSVLNRMPSCIFHHFPITRQLCRVPMRPFQRLNVSRGNLGKQTR